ncbi:MliC family protein [Aquitalea pelogenes]|uniref:MliC family protein n=1 Tax=Aquitalea pelogenes TaxID=1293573 RepID=UPI0035AD8B8C
MKATVILLSLLSLPVLAAPGPEAMPEPAVPAAGNTVVLQKVDYQCAAQRVVSVEYPQAEVEDVVPIRISWHGRHYRLVRVSSASGARYASQQLVWWNKGEQAVLLTRGGRTLARDCQPLLTATTAPVLTPAAP